jgi:hypothetical protein
MRPLALWCCALVLVGCNKGKEEPAMDAAAMPETASAPAAISLADVAGSWTVRVMPEDRDTTLLTYEMTAGEDPSAWTITFPGRPALASRVTVGGDSILIAAGPYESALRKGVQVTIEGVNRLEDGKLMGKVTAHYATSGADSVVHLRTEGTRAP